MGIFDLFKKKKPKSLMDEIGDSLLTELGSYSVSFSTLLFTVASISSAQILS